MTDDELLAALDAIDRVWPVGEAAARIRALIAERDAVGYQYAHDIEAMKARAERAEAHVEELQAKLDPEHSCACSYDHAGVVCGHHSPMLAKSQAERDRYRAVLEAAGYGDLDNIGNTSLDHCRALGTEVARRSMVLIAERDEARANLRHVIAERDQTFTLMLARAEKAEAERDEARRDRVNLLASLKRAEQQRDEARADAEACAVQTLKELVLAANIEAERDEAIARAEKAERAVWRPVSELLGIMQPVEQYDVLFFHPDWGWPMKGMVTCLVSKLDWSLYDQENDKYTEWGGPEPTLYFRIDTITMPADAALATEDLT